MQILDAIPRWIPQLTDLVLDYLPHEDLIEKSSQELLQNHPWKEIEALFNPRILNQGNCHVVKAQVAKTKDVATLHFASCTNQSLIFTKKVVSNFSITQKNLSVLCDSILELCNNVDKKKILSLKKKLAALNDGTKFKAIKNNKKSFLDKALQCSKKFIFKRTDRILTIQMRLFTFLVNRFSTEQNQLLEATIDQPGALDLVRTARFIGEITIPEFYDYSDPEMIIVLNELFENYPPYYVEIALKVIEKRGPDISHLDFEDRWQFLGLCLRHPGCPATFRGKILSHIVSNSDLEDSIEIDNFIYLRLVEGNFSITASHTERTTPLHLAASFDLSKVTRHLILSKESNINSVDKDGNTPLHRAAYTFSFNSMSVLLTMGADPNVLNKEGRNSLIQFIAFCNAREDYLDDIYDDMPGYIQRLLLKKADPNQVDLMGRSALHYAAKWNLGYDALIISTLLKGGADPNLVDSKGMTPLIYILQKEMKSSEPDEDVILSLLEAKNINVNLGKDKEGNTSLHLAILLWGDEDSLLVIDKLLALGANIYTQNNARETPHNFAFKRSQELYDRLKEKSVRGNLKRKDP